MKSYWLWNLIKETYIFIIVIWLIVSVILKGSRHYKTYLTLSAVIYTLLLLYLTLLGRKASTEYKMEFSFLWEYRLALSGDTGWWIQILDNIMLFVPMGWLYGGLKECNPPQGNRSQGGTENGRTRDNITAENGTSRGKLKWLKAILFGLCASSSIELCQLVFRLGLFEFDDILNNTVGMMTGYGVYRVISRHYRAAGEKRKRRLWK